MTQEPAWEISVVIPTYNRCEKLERAIKSVLRQRENGRFFKIKEIWIIDDCSTDDTSIILEQKYKDAVKYYRMSTNSGPAAARNKGVLLSTANWIAFQDSDDVWSEDKLVKQVQYLRKYPEMNMVCSGFRSILSENRWIDLKMEENKNIVEVLSERNIVGAPTILIRKEIFMALGGFDESMKALEDWDFALRYAAEYRFGFLEETLLTADLSDSGVSSNAGNYYQARCYMLAKNRDLLIKHQTLEKAIASILKHADENGMLNQVAKLMEIYLR